MSDGLRPAVSGRRGWGWVFGGGIGVAVLASIPALDGVLWRAAARAAWAALPWLLLAAGLIALVVGLVWLWRWWR